MAKRKTNRQQATPRFEDSLMLHKFLLNSLGFADFSSLRDTLKEAREGTQPDGVSYFYSTLVNSSHFQQARVDKDMLLGYDMNIFRHTKAIQGNRSAPIYWKYFQWACLLFVEIYLDKLFSNKQGFLDELNAFKHEHAEWNELDDYTEADLHKIAIGNATGSGKTLLMHINILQYRYYLEKFNLQNSINRTLLITPNEGLTRQHLANLELSQIEAEPFDKTAGGLYAKAKVQIIDLNKIKEEGKVKTVSVDAFENNNLVLVDEVHKGAKGDVWKDNRDKLSTNGFAFEYSATLEQVILSATKDDKQNLTNEYAKSTIFSYAYKWFYTDGYGKDYRILNLDKEPNENDRKVYLTGALVGYYQQLLVWKNPTPERTQFNIEKPLWVFVGATVTGKSKQQVSDVIEILLFIKDFVSNKKMAVEYLNRLFAGGFLDENGKNVFSNAFNFIKERGETLYDDIMRDVFHSSVGSGVLHLKDLRGANGEITLQIGENTAFGLINVGDTASLIKLCQQHELLVSEQNFTGVMFDSIKDSASPLNILIGSKKFTEGWDCYRVSTMGLMNVGVSEGSEIIQLFGRGVRLKGYKNCLKRFSCLGPIEGRFPNRDVIKCLETLNIFGIRSNYMETFRKTLKNEGMPTDNKVELIIPCVKKLPNQKLKVVRIKGNQSFKKNGKPPELSYLPYFEKHKVQLDWYPKIQAISSADIEKNIGNRALKKETHCLQAKHLAFMDWDKLYLDLQDYKTEKQWYNLKLSVASIKDLFEHNNWYALYIPKEALDITSFAVFEQVYAICLALLKKYCDRFYSFKEADWKKDKLEYCEISADDRNLIDEYVVSVRESEQDIILQIKNLQKLIKEGKLQDFDLNLMSALYFDKHLYNPIFANKPNNATENKDLLSITPVALNEGERRLVCNLRDFCQKQPSILQGKEIYLLRNQSKTGFGFFEEGGFFPDFILWVMDGEQQHVVFIDPKGIRNLDGLSDPKITFYKRIKEIEAKLADRSISLESIIVSVTPHNNIPWAIDITEETLEENHIFFQKEDDRTYIEKIFKLVV